MKRLSILLPLCLVCLLPGAASAGGKKASTSYPAEYEGGNLPLKQKHTVKAVMDGNEVVLVQHHRRVAVPLENISEISCSTDVHRRFGAAVLRRVPRVDWDQVQEHYVGVSWTENGASAKKEEVLFKLSASEYRDFLATLQRATGKQAVDTRKTPTAVRYDF